jgi:L-ascorbate metabolism protein UlaG (beta-lactamase superfamily)
MKITKYPQSCLILESDDGGRIAIDIGTPATGSHQLDELGTLDAVLFTHRHADHLDPDVVPALLDRDVPVYGNTDVAAVVGADHVTVVADDHEFELAGFRVRPRDLPHVEMVDGSPGPPNTGFVFDGRFFHPGDGMEIGGVAVDLVAAPIAGPSVSFRRAYQLVEQVGASRAVPIHYDVFLASPELFADKCDIAEVVTLKPGETLEV